MDLTGNSPVDEGSVFTPAFGNVTDPGEDQVNAYRVHWGDGFSNEYAAAGKKYSMLSARQIPFINVIILSNGISCHGLFRIKT
jgi:hypothetical protein